MVEYMLVYRQDGQWWKESNVKLGVSKSDGGGREEGFEEVRNQLEQVLNI
jgi:hypothetical protein